MPHRPSTSPEELFAPDRDVTRRFGRRRRLLIVTFFAPVLVGVLLVSVGLSIDPLELLGVEGLTWTFFGCVLIAGAALTLGAALVCPRCRKTLPLALLQGTAGDGCPWCGVTLVPAAGAEARPAEGGSEG